MLVEVDFVIRIDFNIKLKFWSLFF